MNWDRMEGNWKQFTGKLKEQWGKLTDDDISRIAGNPEQLEGKIQERCGWSKDSQGATNPETPPQTATKDESNEFEAASAKDWSSEEWQIAEQAVSPQRSLQGKEPILSRQDPLWRRIAALR